MFSFPRKTIALGGALFAAGALTAGAPAAAQDELADGQRAWHWIQTESDEDVPPFAEVAMLCVSPAANRVIIFDSFAPESEISVGILDDGELDVRGFRVGPVDAGVGQRYFTLTDIDDGVEAGSLHLVAPGALGDPREIYMPTLTSVTIDGARTDCLFDPGMRYLGYGYDSVIAVTEAEDGGLVLARWRWGESEPSTRIEGGRWTDDGRGPTVFLFPGEGVIWSVAGARGPLIDHPAWRASDGDFRTESEQPLGYFLADMRQAGHASEQLPYALALHFERLEICRHLAGEWSGNAERDAQVAGSWTRAGCDDVPANQRHYLRGYRGDRPIHNALRLFDLSDIFPREWPR